jgi:CDGSH-type Zn-finger protein
MRVQKNPADIGRCGCGRREYCDGSHGLSEAMWQKRLEQERESALQNPAATCTDIEHASPLSKPSTK